jgi:AraC-like DNA-binding protein
MPSTLEPRLTARAVRALTLTASATPSPPSCGADPTAARLPARLKMSVRTLNRLLAGEGTSFRELLDARRRDLATRYLAGNDVSIAEVAFLLGFSELSSFHRAFKRWTGETPGEFRTKSHTRPR